MNMKSNWLLSLFKNLVKLFTGKIGMAVPMLFLTYESAGNDLMNLILMCQMNAFLYGGNLTEHLLIPVNSQKC